MALTQDFAASGWLQAFMGAPDATLQQARLFTKKHIDWLDVLSSLTTIREKSDILDEALQGLWDYTGEHATQWLLTSVPATNVDWVIPTTDDFTIHCAAPTAIENADQLGAALGVRDWKTRVTMRILKSDFATWQRKVARVGSGAPVGFTMATSHSNTMELLCNASWTANKWVDGKWLIEIDGQPHMTYEIEESIQVSRPELTDVMEKALAAMAYADSNLRSVPTNSPGLSTNVPEWIPTTDKLLPLHKAVYGSGSESCVSRSFQTAWDAVWPILYNRRKKLVRGQCEMKVIRSQLDQAFQSDPRLVTWIFVFGELMGQTFSGSGLGICAKY